MIFAVGIYSPECTAEQTARGGSPCSLEAGHGRDSGADRRQTSDSHACFLRASLFVFPRATCCCSIARASGGYHLEDRQIWLLPGRQAQLSGEHWPLLEGALHQEGR